jgi:hypothetical protein
VHIAEDDFMSLNIERLVVGEADTDQALRAMLEELGVPPGEEWKTSITAHTAGAWEVTLEGAQRHKSDHIDWEIVPQTGGARYRKLFHKAERDVPFVKRAVRRLLWESIQFRENPIWAVDPVLAEAFERAVWTELRREDMRPINVRFGVWREGPDGMKFVCKVEYPSANDHPWSWWSSLVRNPSDLQHELQKALLARRKRCAARALAAKSAAARLARAARIAATETRVVPPPMPPHRPAAEHRVSA